MDFIHSLPLSVSNLFLPSHMKKVSESSSVVSDSFPHYGQDPLSMRISRQEYWSGLPCPPPGDLPGPGIEPGSPALQVDSLPTKLPGKPNLWDSGFQTFLGFRILWEFSLLRSFVAFWWAISS